MALSGAVRSARAQEAVADAGQAADSTRDAAVAEPAQGADAAPDALDAAALAPAQPSSDDALVPTEPVPIAAPAAVNGTVEAPVVEPQMPVTLTLEPARAASPLAPAVEVTVVGTSLARTGGSAHIVRSKELERFEYDDPTAVLLSVPGVYARGEDGMGLRPNIGLRGVDPDRSKKVTLLEDGVLFGPAPYSAPAAYYFPLITRMTQVKVIKGPSAISFGPQTVGGAVDFITRPIPSVTSGAADVGFGQYGYGKAHVYAGTSTDRLGFLVEGVRLQNNGFKELPSGADTGMVRNEWMVKANYRFERTAHANNELRLKLTYADELSNETYVGLSLAEFRDDPNQRYAATALDRMRNHRTSIAVTHQLDLDSGLTLSTTAYRHEFARTWRKVNGFRGASLFDVLRNPNADAYQEYMAVLRGELPSRVGRELLIGPNQRDFVAEGVESRLTFQRTRGPIEHRLEAGLRYHHDYIERRHSEDAFRLVDGNIVPTGERTNVTAFNRGSAHAVAMHLAYAMTWQGLTLTPGMRAELISFRFQDRIVGETERAFQYGLMPGVGGYYAITEQLGVLAGVFRGFNPPPPESAKGGDPEQSINYEAGVRFTSGLTRVETIGFYNDYQNLTNLCTDSAGGCEGDRGNTQFNAGDARVYGVEVLGQHSFPAGSVKLPLALSYTFTQAEFLQRFVTSSPLWQKYDSSLSLDQRRTVGRGDGIPYVPAHQTRATLGVEHARAGGALNFTYVSQMREEPGKGDVDSGLHTDRQYWVDLSTQVRVYKTIQIYGHIFNLLNQQFIVSRRPYGARPNAPFWLQVGVKASF